MADSDPIEGKVPISNDPSKSARLYTTLSAANAGLKLAPAVLDSGVSIAQQATDTALDYTRFGVQAGTSAIRSGVGYASDALAAQMNPKWSSRTKFASSLLNKGLETGSDIVENHVLGTVGAIASTGLAAGAWGIKRSLRAPAFLVKTTKAALRLGGAESRENEYERRVDMILTWKAEVDRMNAQMADVSIRELLSSLQSYARLVDLVELKTVFPDRPTARNTQISQLSSQQMEAAMKEMQEEAPNIRASDAQDVSAFSSEGKEGEDNTSSNQSSSSWFNWWWKKKPMISGPAPIFASDPPPFLSASYADCLSVLGGDGGGIIARACLFAAAVQGPKSIHMPNADKSQASMAEYVMQQCGLHPMDILLVDDPIQPTSDAYSGCLLAVDQVSKRLILAFRGSTRLRDAMGTLTRSNNEKVSGRFGPKGSQQGMAHSQLLAVAQSVDRAIRKQVQQARNNYPSLPLVMAAFGQAGSVASLILLHWLGDSLINPRSQAVHLFTFGSPGVVSPELSHVGYGFCTNFVMAGDPLARLNHGSLQDLMSVVLALTTNTRNAAAMRKLSTSKRRAATEANLKASQVKLEAHQAQPFAATSHPACTDHRELTKLLDEYSNIMASRVGSQSIDLGTSSCSQQQSDPDQMMQLLSDILAQIRKQMVSPKLFPLGHVIHLIPRAQGGEQVVPVRVPSEPITLRELIGLPVSYLRVNRTELSYVGPVGEVQGGVSPSSSASAASSSALLPSAVGSRGKFTTESKIDPIDRGSSTDTTVNAEQLVANPSSVGVSTTEPNRFASLVSYLPTRVTSMLPSRLTGQQPQTSAMSTAASTSTPDCIDLVAGHWSDLIDLSLTPQLARAPGVTAYFAALATQQG